MCCRSRSQDQRFALPFTRLQFGVFQALACAYAMMGQEAVCLPHAGTLRPWSGDAHWFGYLYLGVLVYMCCFWSLALAPFCTLLPFRGLLVEVG